MILGLVDASVVHMVVMKKPAHQAPKPSVQPKTEASPSQPVESVAQTPSEPARPLRPVSFLFCFVVRFPALAARILRLLLSVGWSSPVNRLWK